MRGLLQLSHSSLGFRIATSMLLFVTLHVIMYILGLSGLAAYLIPPALWTLIFIVCVGGAREGPAAGQQLLLASFLLVLLRVGLENLAGIVNEGFGLSPYGWSLLGRLLTIYYVVSRILAVEASRVILLQHPAVRSRQLALVLAVPLLYTLLTINPYELVGHASVLALIKYLNSEFFPVLADNILLTQIAYLGGLKYCIAYSVTYAIYFRVVPVLPSLSWIVRGLLGVIVPLLGVSLLYSLPSTRIFGGIPFRERVTKKHVLKLLTESTPLFLTFLLVSGVVGVKPLIIVSGSMEPTLEVGDVVLVAGAKSYKVGDIVAFPVRGRIVIHRIVGILEDGGIMTKGDANRDVDPWIVESGVIIGKVIFSVPKIGLIPILLRDCIAYLYSQLQVLIGKVASSVEIKAIWWISWRDSSYQL